MTKEQLGVLHALSYELKNQAMLIEMADNTAGLSGQYKVALNNRAQARAVDAAIKELTHE